MHVLRDREWWADSAPHRVRASTDGPPARRGAHHPHSCTLGVHAPPYLGVTSEVRKARQGKARGYSRCSLNNLRTVRTVLGGHLRPSFCSACSPLFRMKHSATRVQSPAKLSSPPIHTQHPSRSVDMRAKGVGVQTGRRGLLHTTGTLCAALSSPSGTAHASCSGAAMSLAVFLKQCHVVYRTGFHTSTD